MSNPFDKKDVDSAANKFPIKKVVGIVVVVAVLFLLLTGSFYNVSEQENAVVTMFGKVVRTDTAGLYFKIPLIQQVKKVDITTHGTGVGYTISTEGQNIADPGNGIMITSDLNLLDIDFYLEYRVSDPVAYLYNSNNPEEILKNVALSSVRSVVADYTVDEAMTTAKGQIQAVMNRFHLPLEKIDAAAPTNSIIQFIFSPRYIVI